MATPFGIFLPAVLASSKPKKLYAEVAMSKITGPFAVGTPTPIGLVPKIGSIAPLGATNSGDTAKTHAEIKKTKCQSLGSRVYPGLVLRKQSGVITVPCGTSMGTGNAPFAGRVWAIAKAERGDWEIRTDQTLLRDLLGVKTQRARAG